MSENAVTAAGVTTRTYADWRAFWVAKFLAIYGVDLDGQASDSPDNQFVGILIQVALDMQDWNVQTNSQRDVTQAIGIFLAQLGGYIGIQPQGATYTLQDIEIVVDRALTLNGLDAVAANPLAKAFTVQDDAGTQYVLITTIDIAAAGTYTLAFRAALPGANETTPNTITVPVTVVLGVTSINNPAAYTTLGKNQETDAAFRQRYQRSTAINSQGVHDSLVALLENIAGVTFVKVWENKTGSTSDGTTPAGVPAGIPRNCIWVIVAGTGAASSIANAIYKKRNMAANMKGAQSQTITQKDNTTFVINWDVVTPENLFIQFDAKSINGIDAINVTLIKTKLAQIFAAGPGDSVDVTSLGTKVQEIDPNCAVVSTNVFSKLIGGPYTPTLAPSSAARQFAVSSARIAITVVP